MNAETRGFIAAFPNAALELDQLEKDIDTALKRTWIMLGLLLGTSLGISCYLVGRHVLL